jgi:CheY-like chemotaxis protein
VSPGLIIEEALMQQAGERSARRLTILMADDDEDDRELTRDALLESAHVEEMRFVADGQELIDYLRRAGPYGSPQAGERPHPSLILLDLNMPRKDGREALAEIKRDAALRRIPVVVLTTSSDDEDVREAYDLGANTYVTKPVTANRLESALGRLAEYWSQVATLPDPAGG